MKWNKIITCFITTAFFVGAAAILTGADQPSVNTAQTEKQITLKSGEKTTPKAIASVYFPELSHKFEPVVEGVKVTHDFVVQNKGNDVLKIHNVKTG